MSGYLSSRAYVVKTYNIDGEEYSVWKSPGFGDDEDYPVYGSKGWIGATYLGIPSEKTITDFLEKQQVTEVEVNLSKLEKWEPHIVCDNSLFEEEE